MSHTVPNDSSDACDDIINGPMCAILRGRQITWHSTEEFKLKIGVRIRRARRHAGLSQVQLSTLISVQRSAVSNWESNNDTYPTMANLVALACGCGVLLEWLGTGRGPMLAHGQDEMQVPAADAEFVEEPKERKLLAAFRLLPSRSQDLFVDLIENFVASKSGKRKTRPAR